MKIYQIERAVVMAVAFLLGAFLAMCVAPGDVLLWGLAGIVLSVFCREYFLRNCGGELFRAPQHHALPGTPLGPATGKRP